MVESLRTESKITNEIFYKYKINVHYFDEEKYFYKAS